MLSTSAVAPSEPARVLHRAAAQATEPALRPPFAAHALLIAAGVLLPFDDLGVWPPGGPLASSPAWLPLSLLAVVLGHWRWSQTREPQPKVFVILTAMLGYGLVLSLATLQFLPAEALGEDLFIKGLKVGATVFAWTLCVLSGWLAWRYLRSTLRIALLVALLVTALFAVIVVVGGSLDTSSLLHDGFNYQYRVRGSRFEASSLGACLLVLGGYLAMTLKRWPAIASQAVLIPATFLLTSSRGSLVAAGLIAAVTVVAAIRKPDPSGQVGLQRATGVVAVVAGLGGTFALGWVVRSDLWHSLGLARGGSDATRSLWGDVAISTTLTHPFGVGFSGLPWIRDALMRALGDGADKYSTPDLREISMLAHTTGDHALAPKTLPAIVLLYLGLPGLVLLSVGLYRLGVTAGAALRSGRSGVVIGAGSLLFVSTTYFSGISAWEQATLIGSLCAAAAMSHREDREPVGAAAAGPRQTRQSSTQVDQVTSPRVA